MQNLWWIIQIISCREVNDKKLFRSNMDEPVEFPLLRRWVEPHALSRSCMDFAGNKQNVASRLCQSSAPARHQTRIYLSPTYFDWRLFHLKLGHMWTHCKLYSLYRSMSSRRSPSLLYLDKQWRHTDFPWSIPWLLHCHWIALISQRAITEYFLYWK